MKALEKLFKANEVDSSEVFDKYEIRSLVDDFLDAKWHIQKLRNKIAELEKSQIEPKQTIQEILRAQLDSRDSFSE